MRREKRKVDRWMDYLSVTKVEKKKTEKHIDVINKLTVILK